MHFDGPDAKIMDIVRERTVGNITTSGLYDPKASYIAKIQSTIVFKTSGIDQSDSVFQNDLYMYIRKGPRVPFSLVVLLPFAGKLWATVGVSVFILAFAWLVLRSATCVPAPHALGTTASPYARPLTIGAPVAAVLDVIQMLVTGSTAFDRLLGPECVAALCAIILGLLLGSAYSGLLLGFLTVPVHYPDPNTIREATISVDRIYTYTQVIKMLQDNESSAFKFHFVNKLTNIKYVHDAESILKAIAAGNQSAIVAGQLLYESLVDSIGKNYGNVHQVKESFLSPVHHTYKVRRNHYFTERFIDMVQRVVEAGLYRHWVSAQRHLRALNGQMLVEPVFMPDPLGVKQLVGPFDVLSVGLSVSLLVFLRERAVPRDLLVVCARVLRMMGGQTSILLTMCKGTCAVLLSLVWAARRVCAGPNRRN